MNGNLYDEYLTLKDTGRRQEAKRLLADFIGSFASLEQKRLWTQAFLMRGGYGHKIRHEIYAGIVFPVLLDGYHRQDAWSLLWLARTARNLYSARELYAQVDFKSEGQLLREAYAIEPNEEIRGSLLRSAVKWFEYSQHEWPAGILYGTDGASVAECEEILLEIAEAKKLDVNHTHEPFLLDFQQKVEEYQQRIRQG